MQIKIKLLCANCCEELEAIVLDQLVPGEDPSEKTDLRLSVVSCRICLEASLEDA